MGGSWKNHFKPSKISLVHENPMTFIASQWQYDKETPSLIYLFLRVAIFITFFVISIFTFTIDSPAGRLRWPIFLTNWGLSLYMIQSFLACVMLIGALIENNRTGKTGSSDTVSKIYSVYWVFNVMATTVAFTITFLYWTLIYNGTDAYWTMNFLVHGFNSILMFFDFWSVSHPVHIYHCIYPFAVTVCYSTMTALFYVCGGTTKDGSRYIYPILKWDEPGKTIAYCIGVSILMVILHALTFLMYLLRAKIYERFFSKPETNNAISDPAEMRML